MATLVKVSFFVDAEGNTYRKATASEAAGNDRAARATVGDKPGFYLPIDPKHLVTDAVQSFKADAEG